MGSIFIGFLGTVLVIRPGSDIFNWNSILPIGASFCYALSIVTLRVLRKKFQTLYCIYIPQLQLLCAGLYASLSITFTPIQNYSDAILLLSMSFCGGFGVVCLMIAYRAAEASAIAPFNYFGIVSAFVLGWVVFGNSHWIHYFLVFFS